MLYPVLFRYYKLNPGTNYFTRSVLPPPLFFFVPFRSATPYFFHSVSCLDVQRSGGPGITCSQKFIEYKSWTVRSTNEPDVQHGRTSCVSRYTVLRFLVVKFFCFPWYSSTELTQHEFLFLLIVTYHGLKYFHCSTSNVESGKFRISTYPRVI